MDAAEMNRPPLSGGMGRHESSGITWFSFPAFDALPWLSHGFTGRQGGTSSIPFRSLNMGLHVGDEDGLVLANRSLALSAMGFPPGSHARIVCGQQVHGSAVAVVVRGDAGRGALDRRTALSGVDALITTVIGIPLLSLYADCVPLFFADPARGAVGLAHAGWRGVVGGVALETVGAMCRAFASAPEALVVGIGPHIRACCFKVTPDVAEKFPSVHVAGPRVDLEACLVAQLLSAGCVASNIHLSRMCTACNTETFFSHRAESGNTGRMASVVCINAVSRRMGA